MLTTIYCKLVASETDYMGYTTYVFENLDSTKYDYKYCMVTRVYNWDHRNIDINEVGYMTYKEVIAGKDSWYNPSTGEMIPYNYTNLYFIKFVKKEDNLKNDIIL